MVMTYTAMASVIMAATALLVGAFTAVATSMALQWALCLIATTGATVIGATVATTMTMAMTLACADWLDGTDRRFALMTARRTPLTCLGKRLQIGGGQQRGQRQAGREALQHPDICRQQATQHPLADIAHHYLTHLMMGKGVEQRLLAVAAFGGGRVGQGGDNVPFGVKNCSCSARVKWPASSP